MSQENVEIIRRSYEAFATGQIAFEFLDDEIEWRGPREFPDLAEPYFGHDGVRQYMAKLSDAFDDYRMVAEEFIDAGGDRVLVFAREGGRGKGSGAEVQTHPTAHLYTMRDGKAVRMQSYWERSDALEALGLRENAEIVQGWLDALRSRADEAVFEYLDPEVQIDWSRSDGPASGTYSGHDESRKLFDEYQDAFEEFWIEPHELIPAGPHVVVPNTSHFRGRGGVEVIARGALVFTVGEGKIVAIRLFQDRAEALVAVGLRE